MTSQSCQIAPVFCPFSEIAGLQNCRIAESQGQEGWKVGRLEGWKVGRFEGRKVERSEGRRSEGTKVGRDEGRKGRRSKGTKVERLVKIIRARVRAAPAWGRGLESAGWPRNRR